MPYCCDGCPAGLNIPGLLSLANEIQVGGVSLNMLMRYEALDDNKRADSCIACGQCREICPQKIDVPKELAKLAERMAKEKSWADICRERGSK